MAHPVVHFEIISDGAQELQGFYKDLFDWDINSDNPMNYGSIDTGSGDVGIKGGIWGKYPGDDQAFVTFYVKVDDIEATLASVESAGGKTVVPKMDVGPDMAIAQFTDPKGNRIGILQGGE